MDRPYEWFKVDQFLIDRNKPKQLTYLENKEALLSLTRLVNLTLVNEENPSKKLSVKGVIDYLYKMTNESNSFNLFFFARFGKKMVVSKTKNTRYIPKRYYEEISGFIDIVVDESLGDICIHNLFHIPWDGLVPMLEIAQAIVNALTDNATIMNRETGKPLEIKTNSIYIPETDLAAQILLSKSGYTAIDMVDGSIRFEKPVESKVSEHIQHISELN